METAMFDSETPVISGNDAKKLLNEMENPKPLSQDFIDEMKSAYDEFLKRRLKKEKVCTR